MMGWYGDGVGWVGWVLMSLLMVAVWGAFIFGAVALLSGRRWMPPETGERDPRRLLDERLARGDIDGEDYERRCSLLRTP